MTPEAPFILSTDGTQYPILLPDAETDYIQGQIVASGEPYEHEMLTALGATIGKGDLVLDIGANIGNHTLWLAHVAGAQVWAFEPNEGLSAALRGSVDAGGLQDRVRVLNCAVGRERGSGTLVTVDETNLGGNRMDTSHAGDVRVVTLDDLDMPHVSAMKIDVEGMELEVLAGSMRIVERDRPHLFIEAMDTPAFEAITAVLEPLGYTCAATYNATPTHHFAPEMNDVAVLRARVHSLVSESQSFKSDYLRTRKDLVATSFKYRHLVEKNEALTKRVRRLRRRLRDLEAGVAGRPMAPLRFLKRLIRRP